MAPPVIGRLPAVFPILILDIADGNLTDQVSLEIESGHLEASCTEVKGDYHEASLCWLAESIVMLSIVQTPPEYNASTRPSACPGEEKVTTGITGAFWIIVVIGILSDLYLLRWFREHETSHYGERRRHAAIVMIDCDFNK